MKSRRTKNKKIVTSQPAEVFGNLGLEYPVVPRPVNPLFRMALLGHARILAGYPTKAPDYAA